METKLHKKILAAMNIVDCDIAEENKSQVEVKQDIDEDESLSEFKQDFGEEDPLAISIEAKEVEEIIKHEIEVEEEWNSEILSV